MFGTSFGNSASSGGAFSGLLDDYPNAAAAYSLRLLKSDYSGALVEIRRESDDTAKSFYSDSNNELSLTSPDVNGVTLGTWIGAGDGFVRTWYDQSGNYIDFIQATTSEQPKIITAGAFTLESSKPVITFDGTDDYFTATLSAASTNAYQSLANYKALSVPTVGSTTIGSEGLNDKRYWYRDNTDSRIRNGGASEGVFTYLSSNSLVQIIYDGTTTVDVYENNSVLETGTISGSSSTEEIWIGDWASTGRPMNFSLSEFIDWQDDDDSRVSGVKTNQNDYYNIYSPPGAFIIATGGNDFNGTIVGDYKYHTFNSSGTFTVTSLGTDPTYGDKIEYLIVAGGGGGGGELIGAGGGAGGLLTATSATVSAIAYSATIGAGGAGGASGSNRGINGSNSTFFSQTAIGGGGGSSYTQGAGNVGGSGGGGAGSAGGAGTAGQGNAGGTGVLVAPNYGQGGGGGAGGVGTYGTSTQGGYGGVGLSNSITGTAVFYAGGGGGSGYLANAGTGGNGGGGNGSIGAGTDGTANTGGGGGGSERDSGPNAGANGGSGIIIVRYKFQ